MTVASRPNFEGQIVAERRVERLLFKVTKALDEAGIAASAGSACNEETLEPSHVLLAMDVPLSSAIGTLRFTVSKATQESDIDRLLAVVPGIVQEARASATVRSSCWPSNTVGTFDRRRSVRPNQSGTVGRVKVIQAAA